MGTPLIRLDVAILLRIRSLLIINGEDRINEEVRLILDAYSDEMRKSGAQYAEMFKKVKTELAKKYKAVL